MVEAGSVGRRLGRLIERLGLLFARPEPLRQAEKYVRGLMSDLPRKNCWTLAEYAGDTTPDRMQRLLERACWDTRAAQAVVCGFVAEHLADPDGPAVLVLDESGQEKTGTATCGVKRQYVGCAGKVANAINLVNATYRTRYGHALVGSRLWIPAEQLADHATRTAMGIPDDVQFKTKPQLGTDLLAACIDAGARPDWLTSDAVYGRDRDLREYCEHQQIGYVLQVPCSFRITLPSGVTMRADTAAATILTPPCWQVASCGQGSKGDRAYAFAWLATRGQRHHLLIRRSLTNPTELAYFSCYVPDHLPATLGGLAAVAGTRWTVEEDHELGKDQFGYDQSQVRRYTPIMRHITLVAAALAVCATVAADARTRHQPPPTPTSPDQAPPDDCGLIALTVPEIKRLFNHATKTWRDISHHLHWSWWRRRHQARARWYHHRTRLT